MKLLLVGLLAFSTAMTTYAMARKTKQEMMEELYYKNYDDDNPDYSEPPNYKFEYSVQDPHSGDFKSQYENRDGGTVRGYYTVLDPDGHFREVHYEADPRFGFKAQVKRHKNQYIK